MTKYQRLQKRIRARKHEQVLTNLNMFIEKMKLNGPAQCNWFKNKTNFELRVCSGCM